MWSANPVANAESGPETLTRDRSINMKASLQLARRRLHAVGSIGLCRLRRSDRRSQRQFWANGRHNPEVGIVEIAHAGSSILPPHSPHASADIDLGPLAGRACRDTGGDNGPCRALEQSEQLLGYEARPRSVEVTIALRVLAVHEKALRHDQVEVVLCAGHGDIEQAPFFLDLRGGADARSEGM